MPFIPHTEADEQAMLAEIGVSDLEALFDEIPERLRAGEMGWPKGLTAPLTESELVRLMRKRASGDGAGLSFLGAGLLEQEIPAPVWALASRGEFYTAYTPYQAEASQGTLTLLYEFQSMISSLCGLEAANASLYDGGSALAEAMLMAVRCNPGKPRRVAVLASLPPLYRQVALTFLQPQGIELVEIPFCHESGHTLPEAFPADLEAAAVVIAQPNAFGVLEEVDALTELAHGRGSLVVGLVDALGLGLLQPPGAWGERGADIACGEGQPFGLPLASGGPYLGLLACRQELVRQMPGRIVGRTRDGQGREGFTLTLQTREQHIRRARATSNICSNQGLMATAATIYLSLLGPEGLRRTAAACHARTRELADLLCAIPGVTRHLSRPFFREVALRLPRDGEEVFAAMAARGIVPGLPMGRQVRGMENVLLVAAMGRHEREDLLRYAGNLREVLA